VKKRKTQLRTNGQRYHGLENENADFYIIKITQFEIIHDATVP
jgi:hypothetical protein